MLAAASSSIPYIMLHWNKSVGTDQNVDGYTADQKEESHFEVLGICLRR